MTLLAILGSTPLIASNDYNATYTVADPIYSGISGIQTFEFSISGTPDNTSSFGSIDDGLNYGYNIQKAALVNAVNNALGTSFTPGALVTVPTPVQTAIASMGSTELANLKSTMNIPTTFDQLADGTTNRSYTTAEKAKLAGLTNSTRTTSTLSLSLVGTGATGTQISSTKDSTVKLNVSTSTTSTIGGPSTSLVALKICATNNSTEGSWTTVATLENDQTISLAIVINSIQVMKGQLTADIPAGWYIKLVNTGTGTHSEAFVSGQQTIFG